MHEKKIVKLDMIKNILSGKEKEEKEHLCRLWRYDMKNEMLYLLLQEDDLDGILLDGIYACTIQDETPLLATGCVVERYSCEQGRMIKFKIKNGFYKNSIKSVDKM